MSEQDGRKLIDKFGDRITVGLSVQEALAKMTKRTPAQEPAKQPRFQDRKPGDRYKSKAEREYAAMLEEDRQAGKIVRWEYEPFGIRIDDGSGKTCVFWPDFGVWSNATAPPMFIEIKGKGKFALRPAARVKFLAARRLYPEFGFFMFQRTNDGWKNIL